MLYRTKVKRWIILALLLILAGTVIDKYGWKSNTSILNKILDFRNHSLNELHPNVNDLIMFAKEKFNNNDMNEEQSGESGKLMPMVNLSFQDAVKENLDALKHHNPSGPVLKKILWPIPNPGPAVGMVGYGQHPFVKYRCKYNKCFLTDDKKLFPVKELDAVLLQISTNFIPDIKSMLKERSPHTRYVFMTQGSGYKLLANRDSFKQVRNHFNWTMTLYRNSDIYLPYGRILRENPEFNNSDLSLEKNKVPNFAAGKTKLIAWTVSNCHAVSNRNLYVHMLRHYAQVDIYGKCGTHNCTKYYGSEKCWEEIARNYKFYLSFENSFCKDYISEKFFQRVAYNMIPVVYGFGPYEEIAPPHSYINILDYESPKELADYLIYLDNNDDAYNEYFKWKKGHLLFRSGESYMSSMCQLCERLHTDHTHKVIPDIYDWFGLRDTCFTKDDNNMRKLINLRFGTVYK